ncbi:MAG: 5'/3'-nucleotidase SurE [Alphaproteobacteria bacterium]|jgi:5'-nucleotidase|nr:5'/3'-nucleotidase SurE [Alphaproteobacteria bacterium]MDP6565400.1 5'/3'-nucleotidase SurE [Alphaproteobacteria bacterium]MDP6814073.1 5'/3'-nucleotidase SurE [Alphaproteobacteria bacterium]
MSRKLANLRKSRILLTNDDGIDAPGLKVLMRIAKELSDDVWVVAPEHENSGASHSLTLTMPLRLRKISAQKFALQGTPTDCVMMALNQVMSDKPPDLLLSGVNRGANMGEDVTYSGTIAAAMEGTLIGVPSIALSQSFANRKVMHWSTVEKHASTLVRRLVALGWPKDVLININFPDVPPNQVTGLEVCRQGRRDFTALNIEQRVDARERPYYWIGFRPVEGKPKAGTDLAAVEAGRISISPLHLDLTENRTLKQLRAAFAE